MGPGWDISVSGSSFLFFFLFSGKKGGMRRGGTDRRQIVGRPGKGGICER